MKKKITRRRLMAVSITAAVSAAAASAQTARGQDNPSQADLAKATREQNQRAGDLLAKFEIPLATEPAFQFKA
jgi:hypothetical protein